MASYKVRRLLLAMRGARLGYTTSDYIDISACGQVKLSGSARVYKDLWIPATQFYALEPSGFANTFNATAAVAGSTPTVLPWQVYAGEDNASPFMIPVLAGSMAENTDARAWTCFFAPIDAASSGSISAHLYWTTHDEKATTGSMAVWRLHYNYLGTGGSAVGGSSGSILYGASMVGTGSGKLEVSSLGNIASFRVAASPLVTLQITLEGSSGSQMGGAPAEDIIGLRLRYVADILGTAV